MALFLIAMLIFVLVLMTVLVFFVLVPVDIFTKFDGRDHSDCLKDGNAVALGGLNNVEESLFERCTVGDQHRGIAHSSDLLGRSLEVMGISSDRHNGHHVHLVANQVGHDISENVRRHRNGRGVSGSSGRVDLFGASTCCSHK